MAEMHSVKPSIKRLLHRPTWTVELGIIAAHVAIAVFLCVILNIWIDECYTINTTGHGMRYALHLAINFESQPPLFFILLTVWRQFGDSILFLRLFSVVCTGLLLYTSIGISRRYLRNIDHRWLLLTLAFNPFLIWAAVEIRLYAFAMLISAVVILHFGETFLSGQATGRKCTIFGFFALCAAYTQYYFWFLFLGFFVSLVATRQTRSLKYYIATMIVVLILFAPMVWVLITQVLHMSDVTTNPDAVQTNLSLPLSIKALYLRIQEYVASPDQLPIMPRLAARLAFAISTLLLLVGGRRNISKDQVAIWTIFAVLVFVFIGITAVASEYLTLRRHTFTMFIPSAVSFLSLLGIQKSNIRRGVLPIAAGVIVLLNLYSLSIIYKPLAKSGDFIRVARYLKEAEGPNQPIFVFNAESSMPLAYYYKGINRIVPLPRPVNYESYHMQNLVIHTLEEVSSVFREAADTQNLIWYVKSLGNPTHLGWNFNGQILEDYLVARYTVLEKRSFYICEVRRLKRER